MKNIITKILILVVVLGSLALGLSLLSEEGPTRLLWLLGKLHPVAVHFPIGLICVGFLVELWSWIRSNPNVSSFSNYCLIWGGAFSLLAAGLGWVNAWYQSFFGELADLLFFHRWLGIAVAVMALITILLLQAHRLIKTKLFYFRCSYLLTVILIAISGHLGALLVHGPDYFTEVIFDELPTSKVEESKPEPGSASSSDLEEQTAAIVNTSNINTTVSFSKDIHPLLQKHCKKCHGGGKHKGDFRIDSRADLLKGGESGPAVVPGNAKESLLLSLLTETDPDLVMPQKGRLLYPEEVELFRRWIDEGLSWGHGSVDVYPRAALAPRKLALPNGGNENSANPIDAFINEYFVSNNMQRPALVGDRLFVRRLYLDLLGRLPDEAEWESILPGMESNLKARVELVDRLLNDKHGYAKHWLSFWNDLLRNDYTGAGFLKGGRKEISRWLYKSLLNNKPYDQFVRELISPSKPSEGFVKGIVWQGKVNPNERPELQAAQNLSQVFLGINLKCASCHNSFTDYWTLKDSYGLANVFSDKPLQTIECEHETGIFETASFLYPELGSINPKAPKAKRLSQLAKLMTDPNNGRFARTIANRIWRQFFGVGLIEPVDNMDITPWNQDLLDWLSNFLVEQNYNLKALMQLILSSNAYQSVASQDKFESFKDYRFLGPVVRRMTAEQFTNSLEGLSATWTQLSIGDLKRAFFMEHPGKRKPPFRVFQSIENTNPVDVKLDLEGTKSLWLVSFFRNKKGKKLSYINQGYDLQANWSDLKFSSKFNTSTSGMELQTSTFFEPEQALDVNDDGSYSVPRFAVVKYDLPAGHDYKSFTAKVSPALVESYQSDDNKGVRVRAGRGQKKKKKGDLNLEVLVYRDLDLYPSLRARDKVMTVLGRPSREQVATSRFDSANTMQSLLLSNDENLQKLFRTAAKRLLSKHNNKLENIATDIYRQLLGRVPNNLELQIAHDYVKSGLDNVEAVSDFIWSTVNLPEVQLIF